MIRATLLFIVFGLVLGCASIQSPTGGPRDETPPILVSAEPPNEQTNFDSKLITLQFNEYFELKDAFNQIVISPPMNEQPEFTIRGKKLLIKLKDELLEERTYTIRFGDAIEDITEKNTLTNFQYVFATGDLIDSLTTSGKLNDAESGEPLENVLVMLYPSETMTDSTVYKDRPYYFAKTDEQGLFNIGNIKEGNYAVFALQDANFNYLYDLPNEKIGYLDSALYIDTVPETFSLSLFQEENVSSFQKLRSAKAERFGQMQFAFATEIDSGSIEVLNTSGTWTYNSLLDTAYFWFTDLSIDTLSYRLKIGELDTIRKVKTRRLADSIFAQKTLKLTSNLDDTKPQKGIVETPNEVRPFDLGQAIELNFVSPILSFDPSKVSLKADSVDQRTIEINAIPDSTMLGVALNANWENATYYELTLERGYATDIYGLKNERKIYRFRTKSDLDYGIVRLTVIADSLSQHVVILQDQGGKKVETFIASGARSVFEIKYLKPGNYGMVAIEDLDKNGKWSTGDYSGKRQPEKTIKYTQGISVRPNWELDIDWEVK